ncbi:hypothetical protein MMC16_000794 [Acarospora aff. strigata]|nr:hypothetical protein [Acarospora aff. strigata]
MFLCSWGILCLNVPGPDDTSLRIFQRRLWLTALAFLGPEFIFQIALGQWISARRSVRDFHALGYPQWTMSHAFFADMGGFILHTRDWTPFPIDAKQLHYLIVKGHVQFPTLSKEQIKDKNKVDQLLRFITIAQIFWFVVNTLGRAVRHLAITCLELTTAAFIVCSLGISICWFHKPADIMTAETIESNSRIADILLEARDKARQPYSHTPLDFVSRKEWAWSLYWSNWINILRKMHIVFAPTTRPVNRFENTLFLELSGSVTAAWLGLTALYSSVFIAAWNNNFPTATERLLWRVSSVTVLGTLTSYWLITGFGFSWYPALRQRLAHTLTERHDPEHSPRTRSLTGQSRLVRKARSVAARIRNNSVLNDPALTLPLKAILPMYVVGLFYCHARAYIFIEDIIELRSLPPSAYTTVDWSALFPHL